MRASSVAKLGGGSLFEKLRRQSVMWLDARYGSGTKWADRSPLGLAYTITGATWVDRPSGRNLNFDGTDDRLDGLIGDKTKVSMRTNDHTVVLGLKCDAPLPSHTEYIILTRDTSGTYAGYILNRSAGAASLYSKFSDGSAGLLTSTHTLTNWNDGNYHLVFVQFDRDGNQQVSLDTGNFTVGNSIAAQNGDVINAQGYQVGLYIANSGFTGDICFLACFNKLLSLPERTALYNNII